MTVVKDEVESRMSNVKEKLSEMVDVICDDQAAETG